MGLSEDALAFYDALGTNDSAVQVLGDDQLRDIAREIACKVKQNATIDWTIKESVRARLMVIVRRILNKHGYPHDKQKMAVDLIMRHPLRDNNSILLFSYRYGVWFSKFPY